MISTVPTGLRELPIQPICPAVNCWATFEHPCGTENVGNDKAFTPGGTSVDSNMLSARFTGLLQLAIRPAQYRRRYVRSERLRMKKAVNVAFLRAG